MNFADFQYAFTAEVGQCPSMEDPAPKKLQTVESSGSWSDVSDHEFIPEPRELTLNPSELEHRLSRSLDYGHGSTIEYTSSPPKSLDAEKTGKMTSKGKGKESDNGDKIKSKFMSAWNNMRHGRPI